MTCPAVGTSVVGRGRRPRDAGLWAPTTLVLAAALGPGGCILESEAGLASNDPQKRFEAISAAAARGDRSAVPGLVRRLDSDDPAERLLAINALERITGERLGYDHAAPKAERSKAVERWARWASGDGGDAR
ncbi:MAG: hypothetical protein HRU70_13685 [Phycisphaeraceae bacterium]|nr:MAG: hypothetical protein HRU70_13685 [Phycisphaeraceae bacterium]